MLPDPEQFDICRPDIKQYLSFRHSVRLCLGRQLARRQVWVSWGGAVLFPTLRRLTSDATLYFSPTISFWGRLLLPVVWGR
ncbi:hypothetical protein [Bradyrhizobium sp. JR3.5]